MKTDLDCSIGGRSSTGVARHCRAFTFIDLAVVLGMGALLAMLLLPVLCGVRADTLRTRCQSNLGQLGAGVALFAQDHGDIFPPAGLWASAAANPSGQMTWDTYIDHYIGGTAPDSFLVSGVMPIEVTPTIEHCPADTEPKASWVGTWTGLRSYEMVAPGQAYSTYVEVDASQGYKLPTPIMGVGIFWVNAPALDWDAQSYRTSVVKDPAGTIELLEEPNSYDVAGNIWPCVCIGPVCARGNSWAVMYQLELPPTPPIPNSGSAVNQGLYVYQAHGDRFNYLFHDGHVAALSTNQTLGTGTLSNPKGMWTVTPGD